MMNFPFVRYCWLSDELCNLLKIRYFCKLLFMLRFFTWSNIFQISRIFFILPKCPLFGSIFSMSMYCCIVFAYDSIAYFDDTNGIVLHIFAYKTNKQHNSANNLILVPIYLHYKTFIRIFIDIVLINMNKSSCS